MNNTVITAGKVISAFAIVVLMVPVFAFAAAPKPECVSFKASDDSVDAGDRVRLSWKTKNATKVEVDPIGYRSTNKNVVDDGHVTVFPRKDTEYTLTVSRGTEKDECIVKVDVKGDVAVAVPKDTSNDAKDTIVVMETRDQVPSAAISIAALPYTGVDTTPLLSTLFFVLLALWVSAVTYTFVRTKRATSSPRMSHAGSVIPHAEYHSKVKEWFIR